MQFRKVVHWLSQSEINVVWNIFKWPACIAEILMFFYTMISSLEVKIVQQITTNHFVIELFVWFSIFGALWNSVISTQYCAERKRSKNVNNKSQNLPIFKSWGPDCKLMTSTAHLAAMTCCNASVLSSPRLHLLVKIFLLDSSWPGCCLCRLTSTPVEERKKSKNYYCIVIDWYEDRSKIFDI